MDLRSTKAKERYKEDLVVNLNLFYTFVVIHAVGRISWWRSRDQLKTLTNDFQELRLCNLVDNILNSYGFDYGLHKI